MRTLLVLLAAYGLMPAAALFAEETTAAFLKIPIGARPTAMGGAFTAVADDVTAVHWNPAGLAQLSKKELGAMHADLFAGTRVDFVGYAHPTRHGTVGLSTVYLSQGSIEGRDANRQRTGTFKASDMATALSFGRNIGGSMSLGANIKVIQSRIADASATGVAADVGARLKTGMRGLSLGASVSNIGQGLRFLDDRSKLPLTASAGAALKLPFGLTLLADYRRKVYERKDSVSLGTEFDILSGLSLRAGYLSTAAASSGQVREASGLGAGLGLKLGNFRMDYAFTPMGELGNSQRLSIGTRF